MPNFENILSSLNHEQRQAVTHIEGPTMVVAGPGTGKTQVLAARVAHILKETDTDARSILCMTFTDAGVVSMRKRLLSMIGNEAYRVGIYTYHSFCHKVIREHPHLFGNLEYEVVTRLEQIEIVREMLDSLDYSHPMREYSKDFYHNDKRILSLFSTMKRENWSVEFLTGKVLGYLESLPSDPEYIYARNSKGNKKGDLKVGKIEEQKEKMHKLLAAAQMLTLYENEKSKRGLIDYDDLIAKVVEQFSQNESLLRTYQEQFLYMLVDEYQDTNGLQYKLLMQLINYWEDPNIFIVGDDDQTIFEFQGAKLSNLNDFVDRYSQTLYRVVLKQNYRSGQPIIDAATALIEHNKLRLVHSFPALEINKHFVAAKEKSAHKPLLWEFVSKESADAGVFNQVRLLLEKGVAPNSIAILYRQHQSADHFVRLFKKNNIPFSIKKEVDCMANPFVRQLVDILNFIVENEHLGETAHDETLFKIMHFGSWHIHPNDMARLVYGYTRNFDLKTRLPLKLLLRDQDFISDCQLQEPEKISTFLQTVDALISLSQDQSLPTFVEQCINMSGLLSKANDAEGNSTHLQALFTFLQFIKVEVARHPELRLKEMLLRIEQSITVGDPLVFLTDEFREDGVQLMTIHSAKGLEWDYVFLIDCVGSQWEDKKIGNNDFTLPPTLLSSSTEQDKVEALRRLFYVGLTRAGKQAFVSCYSKAGKKDVSRSMFLDEIASYSDYEQVLVDKGEFIFQMLESLPAESKEPAGEILDKLLENFKMSANSLNQYLRCPLSFYYENILKVPSGKNIAAIFGTAIHHALELFMLERKSFGKTPERSILQGHFEAYFEKQRGFVKPAIFAQYKSIGNKILKEYYEANEGKWPTLFEVEKDIRNAEIDGIPVTGKIDLVVRLSPNSVEVADYKTTNYNSKFLKTNFEDKEEGKYWRQMAFYKLLYESYSPEIQVELASVHYLGHGKNGAEIQQLRFSKEDMAALRQKVGEVWGKIKAHDFFNGCNAQDCKWCNFYRYGVNPHSMFDDDAAELDD